MQTDRREIAVGLVVCRIPSPPLVQITCDFQISASLVFSILCPVQDRLLLCAPSQEHFQLGKGGSGHGRPDSPELGVYCCLMGPVAVQRLLLRRRVVT